MTVSETHGQDHESAHDALVDLFARGCTCAEAVDYLALELWGIPQYKWAEVRGVPNQAVGENRRRAQRKLVLWRDFE